MSEVDAIKDELIRLYRGRVAKVNEARNAVTFYRAIGSMPYVHICFDCDKAELFHNCREGRAITLEYADPGFFEQVDSLFSRWRICLN